MSELVDLLRQSHNLKSSSPDDFKLKDQWAKVVSAQESAQTMSILLITVAIIVLIVSWIWIMNVMFAWVAERTKEIWILKSIWAKRNDILYQFLVESIILTLIAWLLWVFLGEIIIPLGNGIDWMMLIRSNYGDLLAFMFALLVWIFFWWYPAYIASKLDPVDALRL
jgi:putative ABC transport system permease protein